MIPCMQSISTPDHYCILYNLHSHAVIVGIIAAKEGRANRAFSLFQEMKKRGLLPAPTTYTSLFNACAEGHPVQLERATKVLHVALHLVM